MSLNKKMKKMHIAYYKGEAARAERAETPPLALPLHPVLQSQHVPTKLLWLFDVRGVLALRKFHSQCIFIIAEHG
jgi:hypothetical protein